MLGQKYTIFQRKHNITIKKIESIFFWMKIIYQTKGNSTKVYSKKGRELLNIPGILQ